MFFLQLLRPPVEMKQVWNVGWKGNETQRCGAPHIKASGSKPGGMKRAWLCVCVFHRVSLIVGAAFIPAVEPRAVSRFEVNYLQNRDISSTFQPATHHMGVLPGVRRVMISGRVSASAVQGFAPFCRRTPSCHEDHMERFVWLVLKAKACHWISECVGML